MRAVTSGARLTCFALPMLLSASLHAQGVGPLLEYELPAGDGWSGFLDIAFLADTLLKLTLAALLGAAVAFHPRHVEAADTIEEIEAPKVYILYAVIGSIIGILVVKYDLVVGFVLFGIGGLIRFRTLLRSASLTGRVIFVTLIGLTVGLSMPHVAVLATAFVFVLVYFLEARLTYRIDVHSLDPANLTEAAAAYRDVLEGHGCRVLAEKKNPVKQHFSFLVSGPRGVSRHELEALLDSKIDTRFKGSVDWQTD
jgi:hypothetical protein